MADRSTPEIMTRAAALQPESWDETARTIDVVWTTGAPVKRMDYRTGRPFVEELSMEPSAIDLTRLNSGSAPVLNSHGSYDLADVLGHVVAGSAKRLGDGSWGATLRLSDEPDDARAVNKVAKGIVRNVSVGYQVHETAVSERDGVEYRLATRWEPYEISPVPIGADPGAVTRSRPDLDTSPAAPAASQRSDNMSEKNAPAAPALVVETPAPVIDLAAERQRAATEERERIAGITHAARALRIDPKEADAMIRDGVTLDAARAKLIDLAATKDEAVPTHGQVRVEMGGRDERQTRRDGMTEAMLHRARSDKFEVTERAREYVYMPMVDLARAHLEGEGVSCRGMAPNQIIGRALSHRGLHTAGDFPYILAAGANKLLRLGYAEAPQTFRAWTRTMTLRDFKVSNLVRLGELATLELQPESAEVKFGTIGEGKEPIQVKTYSKGISVSRQLLVNDDLQAFADLPLKFGQAASRIESDLVYAVLTANAAMTDGVTLFHATHKNIAAGTVALGEPGIASLRLVGRNQTGINSNVKLNVQLRHILLPAALEATADRMRSLLYPAVQTNAIPQSIATLNYIVEPRLDANSTTAYYGIADPSQQDTVMIAYLEGQNGPVLEEEIVFDTDGIKMKARLDVGVAPADWRGIYKQAGAAP